MTTKYHFKFPACEYSIRAQIIGKKGKKMIDLKNKHNHLFINLNSDEEIVIGTFGCKKDTLITFYQILIDAALVIRRMKFDGTKLPTADQLKLLKVHNSLCFCFDSEDLLEIIEKQFLLRSEVCQVDDIPSINEMVPCGIPADPKLRSDTGPVKKRRRDDV